MSLKENFDSTKKEWTDAMNTKKEEMAKSVNRGISTLKTLDKNDY